MLCTPTANDATMGMYDTSLTRSQTGFLSFLWGWEKGSGTMTLQILSRLPVDWQNPLLHKGVNPL